MRVKIQSLSPMLSVLFALIIHFLTLSAALRRDGVEEEEEEEEEEDEE